MENQNDEYKAYVKDKLDRLTPIFAKAAIGDFSMDLPIPDVDDDFTQLYVGVQVMLEVIREQLAELVRKKEEMETLLDNTPDIIARFDRDIRHTFISHAIEKITGLPAANFIGKTNRDLGMPEELTKLWEEGIQSVFSSRQPGSLEFSFPSKMGIRYFHARIVPEIDAGGAVFSVLGITHDITELKLAQMEVEKLASMVQSSDEAIISLSLDGTVKNWNKGAEKIYGYSSPEIIGKNYSIVIPKEREEELGQIFEKIRRGVSLEHYETIRVRKDGKQINLLKTITPQKDVIGSVEGCSIFATDVTFRKEAETMLLDTTSKLEKEKSKVDAIVASIGDGVFAVDTDCSIVLVNAGALQLAGLGKEQMIGKKYSEVFRFQYEKDENKPYPAFVEDVIRNGNTVGLINHSIVVRADSARIPVHFTAAPIIDEHKRIQGAVVAIRDYSKERALEKAKDEFISVAAHQLRTPLGIMRWSMELLLDEHAGIVPESLRGRISDIYASNQRMILLVNDLLNVSRIEQGRSMNEPKYINPVKAVEDVLKEADLNARKHDVHCSLSYPDSSIPTVHVDPKRLHESLGNIISNAIKYNVQGGTVEVLLRLHGETIEISVTDSGIGIPENEHFRIFTKFFRAENAVRAQADGSGLGLFIVKSYVEGWGGKVWFESPVKTRKEPDGKTSGYGTTIHITIPVLNEKGVT